ncbi:MAG: hypothetical protein NTW40_11530 [Acidobacteria bacterium]|nr:hypothetical protein [Acidobacteriota bacterium]
MPTPTAVLLARAAQVAALLLPGFLSPSLRQASMELRTRLELAFRLAALHHRPVVLEPSRRAGSGQVAVRLPRGVRWGCPSAIPLPPRLEATGWEGGKPRPITVTPEHRAAANVWFLHHGRQALCLCLELGGGVILFRYRPLLGTWIEC